MDGGGGMFLVVRLTFWTLRRGLGTGRKAGLGSLGPELVPAVAMAAVADISCLPWPSSMPLGGSATVDAASGVGCTPSGSSLPGRGGELDEGVGG